MSLGLGIGAQSAFAVPIDPDANGSSATATAVNGVVKFLAPEATVTSPTLSRPAPEPEQPPIFHDTAGSEAVVIEPPVVPDEIWTPSVHAIRHSDGQWTGDFYSGLEFKKVGSSWVDIDPSVSINALGAVVAPGALLPVVFGPSTTGMARLAASGEFVTETVKDANLVLPQLDASGRVLYRGIRTSSDLLLESRTNGLKEDIILRDASAPTTWTFHVSDPAGILGSPQSNDDGSISFSGSVADQVTFGFGAPIAYEGDETTQAPVVTPGSAHQSIVPAGDGFDVTLAVDSNWLDGKNYPITLDPPVTYAAKNFNTPADFTPWVAARVSSGDTNCGSDLGGCTGYVPSATQFFGAGTVTEGTNPAYVADARPARSFYRPDLKLILPGSQITQADLVLHQNGCLGGETAPYYCGSNDYTERFYPLALPLSVNNTYTQTATAIPGTPTTTFSIPRFPALTRATQTIDLTATVNAIMGKSDRSLGFVQLLSSEPSSGNIGGPSFANSNDPTAANRPVLKMTWTPVPNQVAAPTLTAPSENQITVHWNQPANGGTPIDSYNLELYDSTGTLRSSSNCPADAGCSSPLAATNTRTIGPLSYGTYYARVRAHNSIGNGAFSSYSANITLSAHPVVTKTITSTASLFNTYDRGQTVTYNVNIANPGPVAMDVNTVTDAIPAGLSVIGLDPTLAGTRCLVAGGSCSLNGQTLTASNFTVPANSSVNLVYSVLATGVERGCATLSNAVTAVNDYGSSTSSAPVTVCGSGLGIEPWWSYNTLNVASQSDASINAMNGNLVVQATDSTPVQGRGHFTHVVRRTYNSQDFGGLTLPGSFGQGWQLNLGQADDLDAAGVTTTGLRVPSVTGMTAPLAVTMIDRDGTRHVFTYRSASINTSAPVSVSGLTGALGLLKPVNPGLLPSTLSGTSGFSSVCVDATYQAPAGVHVGLWRYVGTNNGCSSSTATDTSARILGFAAVRTDRVRYDYDASGHLLDMVDGSGVDFRYTYDTLKRVTAEYEPRSCTGIIGSATCRSTRINYTPPTANSYEITDPAGRVTRYVFDSTSSSNMHLLSVVNPPETAGVTSSDHVTYTYQGVNGVSCANAANGQLCSITDARSAEPGNHATTFSYVTGSFPRAIAAITDRRGTTTTLTYVDSTTPASRYVTADVGTHRTRWLGIDGSGRVTEADQGTTSDVYSRVSLTTWDTTSAPCAVQAGTLNNPTTNPRVDNNQCAVTRLNGPGLPASTSTFTYTPEGTLLRTRRSMGTGKPVLDTTYAHSVQYIRSGAGPLVATDSTTGNGDGALGSRSSAFNSDGTWAAPIMYAVDDQVEMLSPRGNSAGATPSLHRTTYSVANNSSSQPGSVTSSNCTSRNSGLTCSVTSPWTAASRRTSSATYDSFGQKLTSTDPRGNTTSYTYYGSADPDSSGSTSADGWLKAVADPTSHFVFFTYDAAGNIQRTFDRDSTSGAPSTFTGTGVSTYTETLRATAANKPWRFVLSQRDQLGNTSHATVDANGNATQLTSARNNTTTQTFDSGNLLTSRKLPADPAPTTLHYDGFGNSTWTQDQRGNYTVTAYDAVNRPTTVTRDRGGAASMAKPTACRLSANGSDSPIPNNEIVCDTKTSYDLHDNVLSSTDGEGQVRTYGYDAADRKTTTTVPRSSTVSYTTTSVYDADGNVTDSCPPRQTVEGGTGCTSTGQYSTHTSYQPDGAKTTTTTYRAPPATVHGTVAATPAVTTVTTQMAYDENDNVLSVTDPNGHVTTNVYDTLNRKISTTVPRSSTLTNSTYYSYSPAGDLLTTIAPAGLDTGTGTADLVVNGSANPQSNPYRVGVGVVQYHSIKLINGGWIAPTAGSDISLDLKVVDSIDICSNCGITLDGLGAAGGTPGSGATGNGGTGSGTGPGLGGQFGVTVGGRGGSAGHNGGGFSGAPGGTGSGTAGAGGGSYGSSDFSNGLSSELGSGGGAGGNAGQGVGGRGGNGGGALHLTTANLILNGTLTARGLTGAAGTAGTVGTGGIGGSGSGGGIWLSAESITGLGPIDVSSTGDGAGGYTRIDAVGGSRTPNHRLGRIRVNTYDAAHRRLDSITGATDTNPANVGVATGTANIRTRNVYDADNNVVGTFSPRAFTSSTTNPDRRFETVKVFDANGRVTDALQPRLDSSSGSGYDDTFAGSPSTQCPQASSSLSPEYASLSSNVRICRTTVSYDANGNRSRIAYPTYTAGGNAYNTYTYTPDNLLYSVSTPNPTGSGRLAQAHKYGYDGAGRVVKDEQVTVQDPAIVTSYTSDGLVATVTAPNGDQAHITTSGYDSNGNPTSTTSSDTATGNPTSYTDYYSDNTRYTVVDGGGDTTSYGYDAGGNTTAVYSPSANAGDATNPSGLPTLSSFYDDNLVKATVVPTGAGVPSGTTHRLTSYAYDTAGRRTTTDVDLITGASPSSPGTLTLNGAPQTQAYANNDRMLSLTGRAGEVQAWTYDADGNKISGTDSTSGLTTTSTYYLDGLVRSVTSQGRTLSYGYDGAGQLYARSFWNGSGYGTQNYTRNDSELPTSWTHGFAAGSTSASYDDQGRQISSTSSLGGVNTTQVWNPDDTLRVTSTTNTSGTVDNWNYRYDGLMRLTAANNTSNAVDCTTSQTAPASATGLQCFDYDTAGRLKNFRTATTAQAVTYDRDGNRLSYGTTVSTYNPDDSLASQKMGTGPTLASSYTTDAFGGVGNDICNTYQYDGFDRLSSRTATAASGCESSTSTITYGYDALDRQTSRAESGTSPSAGSSTFRFDGLDSAVVEESTPSAEVVAYALKPSGAFDSAAPQTAGTASAQQYLTSDGQGDVTAATSSTGGTACQMRYDAYGSSTATGGAVCINDGGTTLTEVLYRSGRKDHGSGTYQLGSRTYDPGKAGFLTPDSQRTGSGSANASVGTDPLTRNTYTYVNGDPINFTDPSGHRPICDGCSAEEQHESDKQYWAGVSKDLRAWAEQDRFVSRVARGRAFWLSSIHADGLSTGGYNPCKSYATRLVHLNPDVAGCGDLLLYHLFIGDLRNRISETGSRALNRTQWRLLAEALYPGDIGPSARPDAFAQTLLTLPAEVSAGFAFRAFRLGVSAAEVAAAEGVDIGGASFAQKSFSQTFSKGGAFSGRTIDDVAGDLSSGALLPKDVPISVIVRDGNTLILNTRSAQALTRAGIPRDAWNVINRTGDSFYEELLSGQLGRNGLTSLGYYFP